MSIPTDLEKNEKVQNSHETISPSSRTAIVRQRLGPRNRLVRLLVIDVLESLLVLLLRESRGGTGGDDGVEDEESVRLRHAPSESFEDLSSKDVRE